MNYVSDLYDELAGPFDSCSSVSYMFEIRLLFMCKGFRNDWSVLELHEWISLLARMDMEVLSIVRFLVQASVGMMPLCIHIMRQVVR